jgi:hypothetical protein
VLPHRSRRRERQPGVQLCLYAIDGMDAALNVVSMTISCTCVRQRAKGRALDAVTQMRRLLFLAMAALGVTGGPPWLRSSIRMKRMLQIPPGSYLGTARRCTCLGRSPPHGHACTMSLLTGALARRSLQQDTAQPNLVWSRELALHESSFPSVCPSPGVRPPVHLPSPLQPRATTTSSQSESI